MKKLILILAVAGLFFLAACAAGISKQEAEGIAYNFMKELAGDRTEAEHIAVMASYKEGNYWKVPVAIGENKPRMVLFEINLTSGEIEYLTNEIGERLSLSQALKVIK